MKQLLFMLCVIALLTGCSKDDDSEMMITNLSGVNWYNTQVWYRDTDGGDLKGYSEVGSVSIGSSCNVSTTHQVFYIYAQNSKGKMIMSKDIHFSGGSTTVKEKDLY